MQGLPGGYLEIRGIVERVQDDSDLAVIDRITLLYLGKPYYGGAEPIENTGKTEHTYFRIMPHKVNVISYHQLV
jgi:hypothetical protein